MNDRTVRDVVRVDAVGEVLLAVACLALAAADAEGAWRVSAWLSVPLLCAFGVILLVVGAVLWWMSTRLTPLLLTALSSANAVTGLVMLVWAGLDDGNGTGVRALIAVGGVGLLGLARRQWPGGRRTSEA